MADFKAFGPGHSTGAEDASKQAGNHSYYPDRESDGKSIGGDDTAPKVQGSTVASRPNPQSGNLSGVKGDMQAALKEAAAYGGHGVSQGGENQTGSSITSPAGERTGHEDGQYGERKTITEDSAKQAGSPGYADRGGTK